MAAGKSVSLGAGRARRPSAAAAADVAGDLCTQPIWVQFVCIVHPEDKLKELLA